MLGPRVFSLFIAALLAIAPLFGAGQSAAAQPVRSNAAIPYKPVGVTLLAAPSDPGLDALRKDLAALAKSKDRAKLSSHLVAQDFFWERDFSGGFDASRSPLDNLSAALGLDAEDGVGWDALAAFAAEPSVGPLPGRPASMCAPASVQFDDAARAKLIEDMHTDGIEWLYPRRAGLTVHAAPRGNAASVETLGLHFVHLLGFEDSKAESDPIRSAWMRVVTPAGKTGFLAPGSLLSPYTDRLCFAKAADGTWRIAGYVGGGD